jgi:N-acetylglucosaminyldiphosphoundecaprenol N-acetyl-beta-D-mannosaminyltransferase
MSANITALRRFDEQYRYFSDTFDLLTADGMGLKLFSGILGEKINNHVRICDLSDALIENAYRNSQKIYLLGAKKKVNDGAQKKLFSSYNNIQCKGNHGYFSDDEFEHILLDIINYKPDLIIVGISSPKKEQTILKISEVYSGSTNIASGGYLDLISGKTKYSPRWVQIIGMEWIFRFLQEPKRMFGPMLLNGFYFLFLIFPKALFIKIVFRKVYNIFYENK